MQKSNASDKPNYQVTLRNKAKQVLENVRDIGDDALVIDAIYQALKDVALESWRNGIEAGRRKAAKPAGSTKQS